MAHRSGSILSTLIHSILSIFKLLEERVKVMLNINVIITKRVVKGYITSRPIWKRECQKKIQAIKIGERKEREKKCAELIENGRFQFKEICD